MTTKRKPYVRPMTSTWWKKLAVLSLLHAARRHGGSGCVVQH